MGQIAQFDHGIEVVHFCSLGVVQTPLIEFYHYYSASLQIYVRVVHSLLIYLFSKWLVNHFKIILVF